MLSHEAKADVIATAFLHFAVKHTTGAVEHRHRISGLHAKHARCVVSFASREAQRGRFVRRCGQIEAMHDGRFWFQFAPQSKSHCDAGERQVCPTTSLKSFTLG
jgi:hypothetical protein